MTPHTEQFSHRGDKIMPPYIGEFGIAILLAILAKRLLQCNWTTALLAGALGGVGNFICYAIAYGITDGITLR